MFIPILFVQCADDDSLAGAGMNKLPVFQVDAHMGGPFLFSSVVEEHQVAFLQLTLLYLSAIFLSLVVGIPFQTLPIYLLIDS